MMTAYLNVLNAIDCKIKKGKFHIIQILAKFLNGIKRPQKTNCMSPFI